METLTIKSINTKTLITYKKFLIKFFKSLNLKYNFFYKKSKKKKVTLLKSPHVKKKNKESFVSKTNTIVFNIETAKNYLGYLMLNKPKSLQIVYKSRSRKVLCLSPETNEYYYEYGEYPYYEEDEEYTYEYSYTYE